jgi:hypothetical protein
MLHGAAAGLVARAQQYNLNAADAWDWFIDDQGRACVFNALDLHFSKGVRTIARPRLVDSSSPECHDIIGSGASLAATSTPHGANTGPSLPQGVAGPERLIVDAIPVRGRQNIPCSAAECGF